MDNTTHIPRRRGSPRRTICGELLEGVSIAKADKANCPDCKALSSIRIPFTKASA